MANLLKEIYSPAFYSRLSDSFARSIPGFKKAEFIKAISGGGFAAMELKERMKHTAQMLHRFMPATFKGMADLFKTMIVQLRADGFRNNMLEFMFLPDYIETFRN